MASDQLAALIPALELIPVSGLALELSSALGLASVKVTA